MRQKLAGILRNAAETIAPTPTMRAVEVTENDGCGVDLEIYEVGLNILGIIKPNRVRINGIECITADEPILVKGLTDRENYLTATVKLFVRSLKVHAVGEQV